MLRAGILVALYTFTNSALADACMLESTQKNFPNKSCMQNAGAPVAVFNDFCSGMGDEDHKMTRLKKCPGKNLASCDIKLDGIKGKFIQYVYTESLLSLYKMTCLSSPIGQGIWKQN